MAQNDFLASADMFSNVRKIGWSRAPMKYRRFANLAIAIRYAVEEMDDDLQGVIIRTDDEEFTGTGIRALYDSDAYPLKRKLPSDVG